MQTHNSFNRSITNINVTRLVMQETGAYNPIYSRPYETDLNSTGLNLIAKRVEEFGGGKISGALLSGATCNIIAPSATAFQQVGIAGGWGDRRIRFMMEVQCLSSMGSMTIYYFQGYTNYTGVSNTGNVATDMEFTINSFIAVNRITQMTPMGMQVKDIVAESAHLLADGNWSGPYSGTAQYLMRPQDIFSGMHSAYLSNDQGATLDGRPLLKKEPSRSSRNNNLPANYIARIIDGYQVGQQLAEYGQGNQDILTRARTEVFEHPVYDNPFIRLISDGRSNGITNRFFFSDLERIDPGVKSVTNYMVLGATQSATLHQPGLTAYWTGSDRETVVATIISHAVPAIMMDLMISKIILRSTNHDLGGQMSTVIIDAKSLTTADLTRNFEIFKQRLEREVIYDFTFGNQEAYTLDITVDLFGETWISISLASGPVFQFVTPSFCDNLFTPVLASNREQYNAMIQDFETIISSVTDVDHGSRMSVNNAI